MSGRKCLVRGCGTEITARQVMCFPHWSRVPKPLRDRVIATHRARSTPLGSSVAHREAVAAALQAVERIE